MAAGASLLAAAAIAATAGSASADTVINAHYALTGSTFIKKLNTTVDLGSGTLAATVDLDTGAVSSTLTLPPATVSMKELGVIPVSATAALVQNGPATGTANLTTNTITSSASVIFKITKLKVAGLNVRSEEHRSELQSRRDLVCRLLLEKKKKTSCVDSVGGTTSA